jgi:AcrR family transcriptional regulator
VLYKHFSSMERIVESVAIQGFGELAEALSAARAGDSHGALGRVAHAFIRFAHDNPALYDAMFTRATTLHFAAPDTPSALTAAFTELREAAGMAAGTRDAETLAEVLWAALHGLITLDRNDRLRPDHRTERVDLLVAEFSASGQLSRRHRRSEPDHSCR